MNLKERNQLQRNFFNEKIETYDEVHSTFMNTKSTLASSLNPNTKTILDLGAGTGLELIDIFKKFPNVQVTVIDISENMLEELNKRDFAKNVTTICGDFFEIKFKKYDAVISTSALHHFKPEEKEQLYKKVHASLNPNGQFINCDKIAKTTEEQEYFIKELETNIENYKHIDTPLTIDNEINILKKCGFKEIKTTKVDKDNYILLEARK